jgi:hypothetical protein
MSTPFNLGVQINTSGSSSAAGGLLGAAANVQKLGTNANVSSNGVAGLQSKLNQLGNTKMQWTSLQQLNQQLSAAKAQTQQLGAAQAALNAKIPKQGLAGANHAGLPGAAGSAFQNQRSGSGIPSSPSGKPPSGSSRANNGRLLSDLEKQKMGLKGLNGAAREAAGGLSILDIGLGSLLGNLAGNMIQKLVQGLGDLGSKAFDLNVQFEDQTNSVAATLAASLEFKDKSTGKLLDSTQEFLAATEVGKKIMLDFQDMAIKTPGTSQDLQSIFGLSLAPGIDAGKTLKQIEEMSNLALTVDKIKSIDVPQGARDLQMILGGQAGIDVKTWSQVRSLIGMTAEEFNKLPAADRFDKLEAAFKKLASPAAIKAYSNSWGGLTSSLEEYRNIALKAFGEQAFKTTEKGLGSLVTSLGTNQKEIQKRARELGIGFANGVQASVEGIQSTISWIQEKASPVIDFFSEKYQEIQALLGDSSTLKDSGAGWKIVGDGLLLSTDGLVQLTVAAGGFIAIGLGSIIVVLGVGVKALGDNFKYLEEQINQAGGGIDGTLKMLGNAGEGLMIVLSEWGDRLTRWGANLGNSFNNSMDQILIKMLKWARDATATLKSIPIFGAMFGGASDLFSNGVNDAQQRIWVRNLENSRRDSENLNLQFQIPSAQNFPVPQIPQVPNIPNLRPQGSRNTSTNVQNAQTLNITQNISAPNPQAAATAANQGVARAAASPFPTGVLGLPITAATP